MRTAQQTLIQKLGFSDEDRTKPDHEKVVMRLASKEAVADAKWIRPSDRKQIDICRRVADRRSEAARYTSRRKDRDGAIRYAALNPERRSPDKDGRGRRNYLSDRRKTHYQYGSCVMAPAKLDESSEVVRKLVSYSVEVPLVSGEKYKYHIGFLDLVLQVHLNCEYVALRRWVGEPEPQKQLLGDHRTVAVEVKTSPFRVTEAIRQMKLYMEHCKADLWVLASTYSLTDPEADLLANEGIGYLPVQL